MLLPKQNGTVDPSVPKKSILRTILTIAIIAGLAWLLFMVVRDLIVYGLYFRYVDELAAKTGLNQYLINALAALGLAPFLLGFKYYFFSLSKERRMRGAAMLLGMTFLYNMSLYVATKDDMLGKFYAITTTGVRISDRVLEDGHEWQKVNRDNEWYVTHLAIGKKVDVAGHDWFDQKSGLPLLWYSKLDNQIQFYDGPGFDRFTAEPLTPVTKELYLEWKRSAQSHSASLPANAPTAQSQTTSSPPSNPSRPASSGVISFAPPYDREFIRDQIKGLNPFGKNLRTKTENEEDRNIRTEEAPVGIWGRLILVPKGIKNIVLDDGARGYTKKYSVRWNGMIEEDFPREKGANPKTPNTVDGFQLKSRETEAINITVKFP